MPRRSIKPDDYEHVQVESRTEWRAWLETHHASSPGAWLVTFKKSAGDRYISYEAAVEEALCVGWIDSKPGKVDDQRTKLLYTPRRPRSPWSATNKRRVQRLIAERLMRPAGVAAVEAAKANGQWEIYDAVETLAVPDDLAAALAATPGARAAFDAFTPSRRKQLLWWVESAKRPETRRTRVAKVVAGASEGRNPLA